MCDVQGKPGCMYVYGRTRSCICVCVREFPVNLGTEDSSSGREVGGIPKELVL